MKRCLQESKLINDGNPDIKIKLGEKEFLKAVNLIADDINKKYKDKRIGLLGLARGALPLLVAVSHRVDIRNINVVQVTMTNSNKKWDYGNAKIENGYLDDEIDEYIVFEDIVSHARSVNLVVNELQKKGKRVLDIYTLCMNNDMFDIELDDKDIDINYVYLICQKQWVNFFWEKGYEE